jgi:hypothetical protein
LGIKFECDISDYHFQIEIRFEKSVAENWSNNIAQCILHFYYHDSFEKKEENRKVYVCYASKPINNGWGGVNDSPLQFHHKVMLSHTNGPTGL